MQKFNKVNQHENILDCRVDCRNNFDPSLHIFNSFFRLILPSQSVQTFQSDLFLLITWPQDEFKWNGELYGHDFFVTDHVNCNLF